MPTAPRLLYLVVYVRDLAASSAFYEDVLGFVALDDDRRSVRYSAGHVILCLQPASDAGVELSEGRDRSIDITFLVEDFEHLHAALQARGVRFSRTLEYEVGTTADFYDPDGHWFSLYAPSDAALRWPSADKIRTLSALGRRDGAAVGVLDRRELVYLFLFVSDADATQVFYSDVLGLSAIEGGPCRRDSSVTRLPEGVVKYDAGGTLLTTHHVDAEHAARFKVRTEGSGGVALAFHAADLRRSIDELARRGLTVASGPEPSSLGQIATFRDPGGHVYMLCQPPDRDTRPRRAAPVERILAAAL